MALYFTERKDINLPLDKYLAKNTSEDNASFAEIMQENEAKHRQRHAWLYETEERQQERHDKMMSLPSIEKQAIEPGTTETETWKYVAKNSLMYVPDGKCTYIYSQVATQKFVVFFSGKVEQVFDKISRVQSCM